MKIYYYLISYGLFFFSGNTLLGQFELNSWSANLLSQTRINCSLESIAISTNLLQNCEHLYYNINYQNKGNAMAKMVSFEVSFPSEITICWASTSYISFNEHSKLLLKLPNMT